MPDKKTAKKKSVKNKARVTPKPKVDRRIYVKKEADKLAEEKLKEIAINITRLGHCAEETAKMCKISKTKLYSMLSEDRKFYDEFYAARDQGKDHRNSEVEDALYKRATGMTIKKQLAFKSKGEPIQRTTVTEEIPPDTRAAEFILSTQRRGRWNPKLVIQHEGEINHGVVVVELPANSRNRGNVSEDIEIDLEEIEEG